MRINDIGHCKDQNGSSNKSSFYDGYDFKTIKPGNFEAYKNRKTSFQKKSALCLFSVNTQKKEQEK